MRKLPVLHPLLIAVFPILALYNHNRSVIPVGWTDIALPLAISVGAASILWCLARALSKNSYKAGLISSLILGWFFSFGHITSFLGLWRLGILDESLFLITLIALAIAIVLIIRSNRPFQGITGYINIFAIILVGLNLIPATGSLIRGIRQSTLSQEGVTPAQQRLPNIFFMVVDGYARADILSELYGYDNSAFIKKLEAQGFFVAAKSNAPYCQTYLSLASTMNFEYLDELAARVGHQSRDRAPLIEMIRNSRLRHLLASRGYSFVALESGYYGTEIRDADLYVRFKKSLSEFQYVLLNTTPLPLVARRTLHYTLYDSHRNRITGALKTLSEFKDQKAPYFVFAHILAPHPPFVFDGRGEPINPKGSYSIGDGSHQHGSDAPSVLGYMSAYTEQLSFMNTKILEAIHGILSTQSDPPVIFLLSDHGPKAFTDWGSADASYLPESLSILNAILVPGGDYHNFYPEISPVNTVIEVTNILFGADRPLLPDRSYFSTWDLPYDFIPYDPAGYKKPPPGLTRRQDHDSKPNREARAR